MRRVLAGLFVLGLVVAHIGWSGRVPLDWPTIALVGVVVAIVFGPEISKLLPLIKRIKVEEAETNCNAIPLSESSGRMVGQPEVGQKRACGKLREDVA
jgi:xanthosine utilization system XapX-like protein